MLPIATMRVGRLPVTFAPALLPTAMPAPNTRVDNDSSNGNASVTPAARRKKRRFTTWGEVEDIGVSQARRLARCNDFNLSRNQPTSRRRGPLDRKSTRLNSSHSQISYAVFCLKKK